MVILLTAFRSSFSDNEDERVDCGRKVYV